MASRRGGRRSVHDLVLGHLAAGLPGAKKRFDRKTGRFLAANGGWAVTMQDVILPLAVLYAAESPRNPLRGKKAVLELACRGGDALRDWQYPDGSVEFIKPDGSRWGPTFMPWSMYHWLEAYALLRDHLDAKRRRRWEKGLRLAFEGIERTYEKSFRIHNIPTWHSMSLVRAGDVFGEAAWGDLGRKNCRVAAAAQHPDGYWPEGSGPTTSYNHVYLHALGLYYRFTGDDRVRPAIERATRFHLNFTYPDGSAVETVDGRVKYHGGVRTMGFPGLGVTPEGRGLLRLKLERLIEGSPGGGLDPSLASTWQHVPDGSAAAVPQTKRSYFAFHPGRPRRALVRRSGPWFVCLSGYLTPPKERSRNAGSRWIMDRAQHVSVWHEAAGLVVGGGNSKSDPERATFVVWSGNRCMHEADSTELRSSRRGDAISLTYGGAKCTLRVRILGPERIELAFSGPGKGRASVTASFTMPFQSGWRLTDSEGAPRETVDPLRTWGDSWGEDNPEPRWFETDAYRVSVPAGSGVSWPQYPFNPYAIDGAASPADAAARVSADVSPGRGEKRFVIRIRSRRGKGRGRR